MLEWIGRRNSEIPRKSKGWADVEKADVYGIKQMEVAPWRSSRYASSVLSVLLAASALAFVMNRLEEVALFWYDSIWVLNLLRITLSFRKRKAVHHIFGSM